MRRTSMVAGILLVLSLWGCPAPTTGGTGGTVPPPVTTCSGFMASGTCFATMPEACSAINCAPEQCVSTLSKPPQAACQQQQGTSCERSQTEAGGKCFASADEACASLSCAKEQCVVTRSLPGHAACNTNINK